MNELKTSVPFPPNVHTHTDVFRVGGANRREDPIISPAFPPWEPGEVVSPLTRLPLLQRGSEILSDTIHKRSTSLRRSQWSEDTDGGTERRPRRGDSKLLIMGCL